MISGKFKKMFFFGFRVKTKTSTVCLSFSAVSQRFSLRLFYFGLAVRFSNMTDKVNRTKNSKDFIVLLANLAIIRPRRSVA